jgi:formamidopyrimidine-DNA glycosylase
VPELPDVEGFRRYFRRYALQKPVRRVSADPDMLRNTSPSALGRALKGRSFADAERHGKRLSCRADSVFLVLHFGMTGRLVWSKDERGRHVHDRLVIQFDAGELRYRNMRKLGGVWLARDEQELGVLLDQFGPDAFRVSLEELRALLGSRRGRLKPALMDQRLIAGLGNLTVDESLWQARLSPLRSMRSLSDEEVNRLYESARSVLRESIPTARVPAKEGWLLSVRGEAGASCPRCGTPLRRATIGGRTTYFCSECQPD